MVRVTVTKYSFNPPCEITELEYRSYRQMLLTDLNIDLSPKELPKSFEEKAKNIAKNSLLAVVMILSPATATSLVSIG